MIPLSELFADHQEFHSDLQMDSFITLRSGGTLYGCYKQSLRELTTRKLALIQRYANRDRLALDIEKLQRPCEKPIKARRNAIDLWEKSLMLGECDRVIGDTEREFIRFYQQAASIRESLAAQGVEFPIDPQTRDQLDCEMWEHGIKVMAAIDFMTMGRLQKNTAELFQSVPPEMRKRIGARFNDQPALIKWYLDYKPPMPPARIETCDVRKLICSISYDLQKPYNFTSSTGSKMSLASSWQTGSAPAKLANSDGA